MLTMLVRLEFLLMTLGKVDVYYVLDKYGRLVHRSFVFPKCFKFPFLKSNQFCIGGPSYTVNEYRGMGIYPKVIDYIVHDKGDANTIFYMFANEENRSSLKGITKAEFTACGRIYQNKMKQFKRFEYTNQ